MRVLTKPQERALRTLADLIDGGNRSCVYSRSVAKALWPDSPAWSQRTHRRGAGGGGAGVLGGTMPMKAASLLGRLWGNDALVAKCTDHTDCNGWVLTPAGRRWIEEKNP